VFVRRLRDIGTCCFVQVFGVIHARLYTCLGTLTLVVVQVSRVVHTCAFVHMLRDCDTCSFVQVSRVVHTCAFVHMLRDCDTCGFVQMSRVVHTCAFVHMLRDCDTCCFV
jgi:hypothetical protein